MFNLPKYHLSFNNKAPRWILLCLFSLSVFGENMYMVALPNISYDLKVPENTTQILSTIYFLGFALGIISLGRVSDIFGRRPVILLGISLYFITSIYGMFIEDIKIFMLIRFITAIGASVGSVVAQAMARDSYQGNSLSQIYAGIGIWLSLAPCIGSFISGYIIQYMGWRYVFLFLSIISLILLFIYYLKLPETNIHKSHAKNIRYIKIVAIVIKDLSVLTYALIIGSFSGMSFGFYMEAPFIFIDKLDIASSDYGKLAFILCLSSAIGSITGKRLIEKFSSKYTMLIGFCLSIIGYSILNISIFFINYTNKMLAVMIIFLPMVLHMLGHGIIIPISLRHALEKYSKFTGSAGSIFGFLYYFIVVIITFMVSQLKSDNILSFTLLFMIISLTNTLVYYNIIFKNKS